MNVYSYLRVSGRSQLDGDGFPRQRDAIAKFCKQHGLTIFGEFEERAVSGKVDSLDRPAFGEMLRRIPNLAKNGVVIGAIVAERADRFGRDLIVSEMLLSELRKRNLKAYTADRGLVDIASNDGDPSLKLIRQVIAAVAEYEKSALVAKLQAARRRAAEKRGWTANKPYGMGAGEAPILELLLQWHRTVPRPLFRALADMLDREGLKNRLDKPWTFDQVSSIIRNHLKREKLRQSEEK